jgi:H+/gluconate symporter-like permease
MTNKTGAYIVFGCIAGIMIIIIFAYYWYYVKKSHNKIVPTNEPVFV